MKFRIFTALLLALVYTVLTIPVQALAANTYYVSPNGDDATGTGSEGSPWRTIQHAVDSASGGDTIKVMDDDIDSTDDYIENIDILTSLTIEKYDNNATNPRIKASDPNDYTFFIGISDVTLRGMDIYGSTNGAGVFMINVTGCTLENNRAGWDDTHYNVHGLQVISSSGNTLTSNTASNNTGSGIYLNDATENTVTSNVINYNDGCGIYMEADASNNDMTSNTAIGNQYGIFMSECSFNTATSNTLNENDGRLDGDGIMLTDSSDCTIANNTMEDNPGDGIEFYNASHNDITSNAITGNAWGIRLNETSSNNIVTYNTISNNNKGIAIQASSNNNVMYLNTLTANSEDNGLEETSSGNSWQSPTKLSTLDGKYYLGNYYDDYGGTDANDDGIGDTAYSGNGFTDSYPLANQHTSYTLLTWYLGDSTMYEDNLGIAGASRTIPDGDYTVWVSDEVATSQVTFPAGSTGDQSCWTYQVNFSESFDESDAMLLTLGYADSDGTNFVDISGKPNVTLTGTSQTFSGVITNTESFYVPAGKYLALKVTNGGESPRTIMGGGSWSYVSSPESSPVYPAPELPTVVLAGAAMTLLFGYFWYRNWKRTRVTI